MPLTFMPCKPGHLKYIKPQPGAAADSLVMASAEYAGIIENFFAISAWANNRCIAAAGIVQLYPGRASAWALISADARPYMLAISRKVRAALDLDPTKRIETVVNCDFQEGHRWAKILGMELECARMRCHGIHGQDEALYVRIK